MTGQDIRPDFPRGKKALEGISPTRGESGRRKTEIDGHMRIAKRQLKIQNTCSEVFFNLGSVISKRYCKIHYIVLFFGYPMPLANNCYRYCCSLILD